MKTLNRSGFIYFCGWLFLSILQISCKENPADPAVVTSLQIEADSFSTHSGGILQLRAMVTTSDGSTKDVTNEASWSNAPALVGTVEQNGLFMAVNNVIGIETIEARYQSQVATVDIDVIRRAGWLAVSPVLKNVQAGQDFQFRAAVRYQDFTEALVTDKVEWSVRPGQAASIDENGLLSTISAVTGIETVQASYHGWTAESEVDVQLQYQSRFDMVEIPAGPFIMGDDNGFTEEQPAHEVLVSGFEIGRYEVTNAEYARFLTEALVRGEIRYSDGIVTRGKPPFLYIGMTKIFAPEFEEQFIFFVGGEDDGRFEVLPGFENHPVGRLHWYGALVFCDFYGLRLPTEAEWEKACRGGQQFEFGTADGTLTGNQANLAGQAGADIYQAHAPVGSFLPNPYGLYDMTGNVSEFVFDLYDPFYYQNSPSLDPSGPGPVTLQTRRSNLIWLTRGGAWVNTPQDARAARRAVIDEPHDNVVILAWSGFRVVRSLP